MILADETVCVSDWLAVLRDPVLGELKLSSAIETPDQIVGVLRGFGERPSADQRRIVASLNEWAVKYRRALDNEPRVSLKVARERLQSIYASARKLRNLLEPLELRRAIEFAHLLKVSMEQRGVPKRGVRICLEDNAPIIVDEAFDALLVLDRMLEDLTSTVEAANEIVLGPELYHAAMAQPPLPRSRKTLERALLWEPLLHLMQEFGIEDFSEHQDLIVTVRSFHLALGIAPPNRNLLKGVTFDWRKRRLSSAS